MTKREVVQAAVDGKEPPYTPWSFGFTREAAGRLARHYGTDDLDDAVGNHILGLGSQIGFFEDIGGDRFRDVFGVVWDRSVDKDIGNVANCVLPEPTLDGCEFPDPLDARFFEDIPARTARHPNRYRLF
ncbi:MAG: uroporphyrinogen decarboxylase family protein, partial [Planctomycetota bacterium]